MHFNVKSLKMIKFVFKTHASGGGGVSTGDFGIDLCAKMHSYSWTL